MFLPIWLILGSLISVFAATQNVTAVTCTITRYNAEYILHVQEDCDEIIIDRLFVPGGTTLDLSKLKKGARVVFSGIIIWEYKEWRGPLLRISGTDIEIVGAYSSLLLGRGNLWWDGLGETGGKLKPRLLDIIGLRNSVIKNLEIRNSPAHAITISESEGLVIDNVFVDNKIGDFFGGRDTDGFDISESINITIKDTSILNQGSCLEVKSGKDVSFVNSYCSGGQGIAIGSERLNWIGSTNIEAVNISHCVIENSANGITIKTVYGTLGSISNITVEDIVLMDISNYGVAIQSDYINGVPTGTPSDGVKITDLTLKNIAGTVLETGVNIYVLVEGASNWHCSEIVVIGGEKVQECHGIPPDAGLSC